MKLGKFEILEEIGRGGFGIVYKAKDLSLDRLVALKVLLPEHLGNTDLIEAFKREARHMAKISHPNVIQIYEVGEVENQIFIAMQYCVGGSLEKKIKDSVNLRLQDAIRMLYQVAHGLDAGHKIGLIHRDIKPSNILFNATGEAVIGDFGISKAVMSTDQTAGHTFNQFSGTPFYVPPELWQGKDLPTPAADIYSLACVFYEVLTGEVLFAGDTFVHVLSRHMLEAPIFSDKLPRQLVDVITVALAKKPEDRFQTMSDFLTAVRRSFVGLSRTDTETAAANVSPAFESENGEKPTSEDISFTQIVRRSQNVTGKIGSSSPQANDSIRPPVNTAKQGKPRPQASTLPPSVGSVPQSGLPGVRSSSTGDPSYRKSPRSEAPQAGEKSHSQGKKSYSNNSASTYNEPNQNLAGREQKEKRRSLFIIVGIGLLALAAIVFGSILLKNNIAASNTVLTLTNLPSATSGATPTSTQMIAVPQGNLKFASMGSMVSGVYQTYPQGGSDNPKWTVSGSETWKPVSAGEEITLGTTTGHNSAQAIDLQTFSDVGMMLFLGAKGQVNSSVFIYGSSDATITYTDILEMELRQGTVFLKLESRSEIAQITLPNQQNAVARLTGGSMLLHLNGDEVQLWCLKDDCSLDFARESERTFAVQRRSYFPAIGTIDQPLDIIPAHYDELWAYNVKCNKCMDANLVPEPSSTPTSTSTPWPTYTLRPTDTPKRPTNTPQPPTPSFTPTNTPPTPPTPTSTSQPPTLIHTWPPTPTFTRTNTATPQYLPTYTPFIETPTPYTTSTSTNFPTPTPSQEVFLYIEINPSSHYGTCIVNNPGPYYYGDVVTLTAKSLRDGWAFSGWGGACSGTTNPCTLTMNGSKSVIAYFSKVP